MPNKMSANEIVFTALIWAIESMDQMISGTHESDPYRAELIEERRQLRAYRNKRFGKPVNPFKDAKLVDVLSPRKSDH